MTAGDDTPVPGHAANHRGPPVVGLGASAGGIQALQVFFSHVPLDSDAAYVVILHLSPDDDSLLAGVLQHSTPLRVTRVEGRTPVEPNRVYVVSPGLCMTIAGGELDVVPLTRVEQRRAPVDLFFRALGDAERARAVCVILSGTGPNGSAGLKRVKEYGGLVVVQEPGEAEHGDMPRNALVTGLVDLVLPVAEMPARIVEFHRRFSDAPEATDVGAPANDHEALATVIRILRARTGHDFSNYKEATIARRIARRMHVCEVPTLEAYGRLLRDQPGECKALVRELLISVTSFFRDPKPFEVLAKRVLPRVFENKGPQDHVRAWVAGCATGEEAYSVAMLLSEAASLMSDPPPLQVFATDVDEEAIITARDGYYSVAELTDVPEERLQVFFQRQGEGYRVRRDLREIVLFAHHNLLRDPPFSHLDLISCRNVLSYLNRAAQERTLETFHFALRPGGFLMLGTSETADTATDLFHPFDKGAHIVQSRTATSPVTLPTVPAAVRAAPRQTVSPLRLPERVMPVELHQRLLEQYAPPSILVSEDHSVLHVSEQAGRYLAVPGGEPTRDLFRMLRPELRGEARQAVMQAIRERRSVEVRNLPIRIEDEDRSLTLLVRPALTKEDPARGFVLLLFDHTVRPSQVAPPVPLTGRPDSLVRDLEGEVAELKTHLRTTIEQYEMQAEEEKASNEELQAMNEELRSAAEELETSKEELQSVNEELTTVNQELKVKLEELRVSNNNFQNLIHSIDVGTIFLDRSQRIRLSTPAAQRIFNLRRTDTGRPLSDITHQLTYDGLHEDVSRVMDHLATIDRQVQAKDGACYLMRLRPYRTVDERIEGVVITFQDISARVEAERHVRMSETRLRLLIDSVSEYAIFTMDPHGAIDSWNAGAQRMFGYAADEIVGTSVDRLFTPEDRAEGVPRSERARAAEHGVSSDERFHMRKDGSRFFVSGITTRIGQEFGFAKIARDLTQLREAAEKLRLVEEGIENQVLERTGNLESRMREQAAAQAHIVTLLRKVVTAQEDERARIARDLHDQLGQDLAALRLALERLGGQLDTERHPDLLRALDLARQIDRDVDFLAWELRPAVLDDLGLSVALPRFVRQWSEHHGLPAEYRASETPDGLSREAEVTFYRITQEALTNVLKHAHASRVDVLLEFRDGVVTLVIEDNGVGFDPADHEVRDRGIGLVGMEERARLIGAVLHVESSPGKGTSVFVRCPVDRCAAEGS